MEISFCSEIIEWRGPAPFLFAPIPKMQSDKIKLIAKKVTYGWGVIPVEVTVGKTTVTTSLFPKDEVYLLPIKIAIQRAEDVKLGDRIKATILIDPQGRFR